MIGIILNLIIFVLVLGAIVFVHELGHFLFAKWAKVHVYEFAIGMGPKLWGLKKGETDYSLRAIPIGGYCHLAGEDTDDSEDAKLPKGTRLYEKSVFKRFLIMFFGAGFNFIFAFILLFGSGLIWGSPNMDPIIYNLEEDKPAINAGLEEGDLVTEIDNNKVSSIDDLALYLALADPKVGITMDVEKENGNVETYKIKPEKIKVDGEDTYRYGIGLQAEKESGFLKSLTYSFEKMGSLFKQMFITLKELFTGGVEVSQLSGPVGIFTIVGDQAANGIESVIYLTAFLSLNVGFLNLLPFPAFDGGRILFLVIEKIKGSPIKPEIENKIHFIGFFLLIALLIYVTVFDILRLF